MKYISTVCMKWTLHFIFYAAVSICLLSSHAFAYYKFKGKIQKSNSISNVTHFAFQRSIECDTCALAVQCIAAKQEEIYFKSKEIVAQQLDVVIFIGIVIYSLANI